MWSEPEPAPFRVPVSASRTGSSWALAALPALVFASWLAALASGAGLSWTLIALSIALASAIAVLLARADVRALSRAGYDETASPYLAVIPVFYLFHRGHLCASRNLEGYGPAWLHVGIVVSLVLTVALVQLFSGGASLFSFLEGFLGSRVAP